MMNPLLEVKNVTVFVPFLEQPVLEEVSFALEAHHLLILLGGNGSGKSSLLKTITGRYQPFCGTLSLQGKLISELSAKERARRVVSITQDAREMLFYDLSVLENCLLWEMRVQETGFLISTVEAREKYALYLQEFNPRLSTKLDTPVERLSGGERQALALALCFYYPPELLLLDEHTSALDPKTAIALMELTQQMVEKHKITTIMATHNLEHALQYGDEVIALKEGKITFTVSKAEKKGLTKEVLLHACY